MRPRLILAHFGTPRCIGPDFLRRTNGNGWKWLCVSCQRWDFGILKQQLKITSELLLMHRLALAQTSWKVMNKT